MSSLPIFSFVPNLEAHREASVALLEWARCASSSPNPCGLFDKPRDPRPLHLEAVLGFDQSSPILSKRPAQLVRCEQGFQMPIPILGGVRDQSIFAVYNEIASTPDPRRNEGHTDGHVLDLLEPALALSHQHAGHGRESDVDLSKLSDLVGKPPRPRMYLHGVQLEVIPRTDDYQTEWLD